jgi:hypothetical protein
MKKFLLVFALLIVGGFYLFGGVNNFPPSSGSGTETDPIWTSEKGGYASTNITDSLSNSVTALQIAQTNTSISLTTTNAGNVTINFASGIFQQLVITNTTTLLVPTNGTTGSRLELWITANGADRSLTVTNAVKIPSDSALTWPKTLTSNLTYIVLLRCSGTNWWLTSLVGGY